MQLMAYLTRENLTYSEFARRTGTPHARTIERIAKGARKPGNRMMPAIIAATNGEVTPNDFYDLPRQASPASIAAEA
ncbi:XRE family transcriptional regulator [Sphingomonas montanisoli]|uniref:XRE family transcriptional regulator n=1 Tax=Sphingomonas montanisoli TaxID=2606412 RepID=A0A5D9CC50_9SPHN|nr:XRE family transcriptional regulator [Sphingomonas montanisoli]